MLDALGHLVDDRQRLRRNARDRAAEEAAVRARRPSARPNASWVMGRSARWHDPDVLAELRMHELMQGRQAFTVLGVAAGYGYPGGMLIGIRRGLRALRQGPRR